MSGCNGLVVRNTFLEIPVGDDRKPDDGGVEDEGVDRRPRAVSDLTDMKLPWKMAMSDQAEGVYQIQRRRLGSGAEEGRHHGEAEPLQTVEEDPNAVARSRKNSRRLTGGGNRRSRVDTAEFVPGTMGGMPVPGFYPPMPMGPPGPVPMLPPGYPPWGYPSGYPPPHMAPPMWGRWPEAGMGAQGPYPGWPPYPGLAPPSPPTPGLPQQGCGGSAPKVGKGGGKQKREQGNAGQPSEKSKNKGGAAKPQSTEGTGKASAPAPEHPEHKRTTVMFRNIPDQYTSGTLLALLDEYHFQTLYNFVYLPMDFGKGVNLGYAFVNLISHEEALRFMKVFNGFRSWRFESKASEAGEVSWAHPHQGWDEHVERYRNSPVMHPSMPDEYKPMIFQDGARVTFPQPYKVIKAPKLRLGRERPPQREPGREEALREGLEAVPAVA